MLQYDRAVSDNVLDHYCNPRNCGTLDMPSTIGELVNPDRGIKVVFYLLIENDIILDIKFQTIGCNTLIASASILTQIVKSKAISEAGRIEPHDISAALDCVPNDKMYCCELVVGALQIGIDSYKKEKRQKDLCHHPCFHKEAHFKYGRIHLPVSPECNIQCRFCARDINKTEHRPGASRTILTSAEAVDTVERTIKIFPQLTVVGVAGPGDSLASEDALETFDIIHTRFPNLINCMSTNGLLLEEYANRIIEVGVGTISVTVNAVDSVILQRICSCIKYHGKLIFGLEAANILIDAQLKGIRKMAALGATIKINTVLIPGINEHHIEKIAKTVSSCGATIFNIMPLIPESEFKDMSAPTCTELNIARKSASKYLEIFRHCQQCRADACGIPGLGEDISEYIYL